MEFLKKNIRTIIGFIISVILASSITVYAYSYLASDIKYTNDKSVSDALNDLYLRTNIEETKIELIGKEFGQTVTIPTGYKYVIIDNMMIGAKSGR